MKIQNTAIIILNYNGWKDTIECLESLYKLETESLYTTFVVDNSPSDESIHKISQWAVGEQEVIDYKFPEIICPFVQKPITLQFFKEQDFYYSDITEKLVLVKAKENKGFSAGNNIVLKRLLSKDDGFDWIWLLNNDTVVEKDALKNQIEYYYDNRIKKIGVLGSVMLYYFQPDKIQSVGGKYSTLFYKAVKSVGEGKNYDINIQKETFSQEIDYVEGASMFIPKEFLKDVGILSEDYFLYYEELDWAYRAREKSWKIDWCPTSVIYHKGSSSIGAFSNCKKSNHFSEIQLVKSRKKFYEKFYKKSIIFWVGSVLIIANKIIRLQFKLTFKLLKYLK